MKQKSINVIWVMEMEANSHQCINVEQLIGSKWQDDGEMKIRGYIPWINDQTVTKIPIENVSVVPESDYNILSLKVIMEKGFKVKYSNNKCEIFRKEVLVLNGLRKNEQYIIETNLEVGPPYNKTHVSVDTKPCELEEEMEDIAKEELEDISETCEIKQKEYQHDEKLINEICNEGNVWDLRIKFTDIDNIEIIVLDDAVTINFDLEFDWSTSRSSKTEINVDKDDRFLSKYKCDSPIDSLGFMDSMSSYIEGESSRAFKIFKISKPFNDKEDFKRFTKTSALSLRHKQSQQPQDSLPLLQQFVSLQVDNGTNIEKMKKKWKKCNSKIVRTYEHDK